MGGNKMRLRYTFENTSCNMDCKYCFSDWRTNPKKFSTKELIKYIDILKKEGVDQISFTGGEPLLIPDIETLIEYSANVGLRTVLCTNGILLHEKLDGLMGIVDTIALPLDSCDPEVHNYLRPTSAVDNHHSLVVSMFRMLHDMPVKLNLNSTVTRHNYDTLQGVGDLVGYAVKTWVIDDFRTIAEGKKNPNFAIPETDFKVLVNECIKVYPQIKIINYSKSEDSECRLIKPGGGVFKVSQNNLVYLRNLNDKCGLIRSDKRNLQSMKGGNK